MAKAKMLETTLQTMVNKLSNFEEFVASIPNKVTDITILTKLELHMEAVKDLSEKYEQIYIELSVLATDAVLLDCSAFCNRYINANARAKTLLKVNAPEPTPQVTNHGAGSAQASIHANAKLSRIAVPSYDGNYTKFTSFYELFVSLVHNNRGISDVEKFVYLQTSLTGTAAQTIANITPSAENYKIAFDLICERYNNPKLITLNHIKGIMDLNPISKHKSDDLRQLFVDYSNHIRALENLKIQVEHSAPFIYYILMSKFDANTKAKFTEFKPRTIPTLAEITEFLKQYCEVLEEVNTNNKEAISSMSNSPNQPNYGNRHNHLKVKSASLKQSFIVTKDKPFCQYCNADHFITQCPKFLALSVKQRFDKTTELRLCKNCLRHSSQSPCNSKYNCKICLKRHSTLLHFEQLLPKSQASTSGVQNDSISHQNNPSSSAPAVSPPITLSCFRSTEVLLSTACVNVRANNDKWYNASVILDNGSHSNFITEDFAKKLGSKLKNITTQIMGIDSCSVQSNSAVQVQVASKHNDFKTVLPCLTIRKIAANLPLQSFDKSYLNIPSNIKLADNNFNESSPIDILIGAGNFYNLMCIGQIALGKNKPILQKTLLGWIISGTYRANQRSGSAVCANLILDDYPDPILSLDKSIQDFWRLEDIQPCDPLSKLSREERFCEEHFVRTVSQNRSGRFTVTIPFNANLAKLGHSKEQAVSRFLQLERKLSKNPELYSSYLEFMSEYVNLGHMSEYLAYSENASPPDTSTINTLESTIIPISKVPPFYLPHHAVIKSTSLTTKLRLVFDGSAKSSSNISINNTQVVGLVIQDDLFTILVRFRQHRIALTIAKF